MTTAAMRKVRMSAAGKEYSSPSRPQKRGKRIGSATPKTISRVREITVDSTALPRDWRKMNVPLLTLARTIMHR